MSPQSFSSHGEDDKQSKNSRGTSWIVAQSVDRDGNSMTMDFDDGDSTFQSCDFKWRINICADQGYILR